MNKIVVLIDDDEDILDIMDIVLQDAGYTTYRSQSGLSPDIIGEINPALIITDVRINGFEKTGVELCSEYKTHPRTAYIPVLLISAEFDLETLAAQSGADGFITKPFDIDHVIDQVKKHC